MTSLLHRIGVAAVIVIVAWIIAMSLISRFGNGFLYHIDQPVPVLEVRADEGVVLARATRTSLLSMPATCARKVKCGEQTYLMRERPCPVHRGTDTWVVALPLPKEAEGECVYRGSVSYQPFGPFGPYMSFPWESVPFTIPKKEE